MRFAATIHRRRNGAARVLAGALLCLLAAGCGDDPPVAGPSGRADLPSGERCLAELASRGAVFDREEDFRNGRGCGIDTAITLTASAVALDQPMTTSCAMALAFDDFQRRVAAPLAERHLGSPLVRIHHYGSYSCRGRSSNPARLSEHAFARAVDVSGFETADGRIVTLADHWSADDARERFLKSVGEQACSLFGVVLGPSADAAHRNHFHFDIGPWGHCEP